MQGEEQRHSRRTNKTTPILKLSTLCSAYLLGRYEILVPGAEVLVSSDAPLGGHADRELERAAARARRTHHVAHATAPVAAARTLKIHIQLRFGGKLREKLVHKYSTSLHPRRDRSRNRVCYSSDAKQRENSCHVVVWNAQSCDETYYTTLYTRILVPRTIK